MPQVQAEWGPIGAVWLRRTVFQLYELPRAQQPKAPAPKPKRILKRPAAAGEDELVEEAEEEGDEPPEPPKAKAKARKKEPVEVTTVGIEGEKWAVRPQRRGQERTGQKPTLQ
eukprot:13472108-Alexandrium_andersonii.AAC.1